MKTIMFYTRNFSREKAMINYYQKFLSYGCEHITEPLTSPNGDISLIVNFPPRTPSNIVYSYIYRIKEKYLQQFLNSNIVFNFDKLLKHKLLLSL